MVPKRSHAVEIGGQQGLFPRVNQVGKAFFCFNNFIAQWAGYNLHEVALPEQRDYLLYPWILLLRDTVLANRLNLDLCRYY